MTDDIARIIQDNRDPSFDLTIQDTMDAVKAVEERHPKAPKLRTMILLWSSMQKLVFQEVMKNKMVGKGGSSETQRNMLKKWSDRTRH